MPWQQLKLQLRLEDRELAFLNSISEEEIQSPKSLNNEWVNGLQNPTSWHLKGTALDKCKWMWVFPKIRVPQNGWFTMENPIKMDDLGGPPLFLETPMWKSLIEPKLAVSYNKKTSPSPKGERVRWMIIPILYFLKALATLGRLIYELVFEQIPFLILFLNQPRFTNQPYN